MSCQCQCHTTSDAVCDSLGGCASSHPRSSPPRYRKGPEQVAARGQTPCLLDRQPAGAGATLCTDHCDELRLMLDPDYEGDRDERRPASIPVYWARLDPTPGTTDPADRRSPGFASSPPLNLHVVALRDGRSRPDADDPDAAPCDVDGEVRPVRTALAALAGALWEHLELQGPRLQGGDVVLGGVAEHAAWLLAHLDDLTAHPAADDIWRDLVELQDSIRGPAGDPPDRPIGACTGSVRRADGEQVECGAPLYMPPPRPDVVLPPTTPLLRCARCDRPYSTLMLLRLELSGELAS